MYNSIGYLPEERGLHPKMTVEEELTYLATLKGLSSKEIRQRIDYWLERFAITENRKSGFSHSQREINRKSNYLRVCFIILNYSF